MKIIWKIMNGYHGKFLKIDLTTKKIEDYKYPEEWKDLYIGGRGFAVKLLWDNVKAGVDPLGPENWLIFAIGPLSGWTLPSSSKMVVAAKSPLTGGYGDGNLGTRASPQLKKAGYDGIIITGKAEKPVYIEINDSKTTFHDANEIWGLGTYDTEKYLGKKFGIKAGFLSIGQAGENLVKYSTVRSQEGRSGGRPGMGAVMGSKNLKSIIITGTQELPAFDPKGMKQLGKVGYQTIKELAPYDHWMAQGTTAVLEWCNETSTLPTRNFQEGNFNGYKGVDGDTLASTKITQYGCPRCNMQCGMVIKDQEGNDSELDYENIGMLGPNIGIDNLPKVGVLNYMADDYGLDTISLGSVLGMAAEASEKGVLSEKFEWGDYEKAKELVTRIALRSDKLGTELAEGTRNMAKIWGGDAYKWAVQVKGLECSAYNSFTIPGMALSFGTSPIGAHHKDAWVISWEISESQRESYGPEKAAKVIELQRIRGGMFESLVTCRFPWIELGYEAKNYPEFLKKVTGKEWDMDKVFNISDRIYAMMRAYFVREYLADGQKWDRTMDYPPAKWFETSLIGEGTFKGSNLEKVKYDQLLDYYYSQRGWDKRGVPTKECLKTLKIDNIIPELEKYIAVK